MYIRKNNISLVFFITQEVAPDVVVKLMRPSTPCDIGDFLVE